MLSSFFTREKVLIMTNMKITDQLSVWWKKKFKPEFEKDYFLEIKKQIVSDINLWETIYPPLEKIFFAFEKTSFDDLKVVILWQDPYHGNGQAHGLSFSVPDWIIPPPSLKNIYKELRNDLGFDIPNWWNLEKWTSQWILLLNAILTVKAWIPASHSHIGWETFTNEIIKYISDKKENIIFILWGNFAKSKKQFIDEKKHFIIKSAHPSPFSAYNWFFGSKPFSKTNEILKSIWKKEIDWKL